MDLVKEDMADIEVTQEDTEDRNNWRWKIRCAIPDVISRKKKMKKKEDHLYIIIGQP